MHKTIFLIAMAFSLQAPAAELVRCGTDAFGNTVCLDKDGVLTNAPKKPAPGRTDRKNNGKEAGAAVGSGANPNVEESKDNARCGIDQFGNKVCRQ